MCRPKVIYIPLSLPLVSENFAGFYLPVFVIDLIISFALQYNPKWIVTRNCLTYMLDYLQTRKVHREKSYCFTTSKLYQEIMTLDYTCAINQIMKHFIKRAFISMIIEVLHGSHIAWQEQ